MSKDGINETQCEQMTTYAALILHDDGPLRVRGL